MFYKQALVSLDAMPLLAILVDTLEGEVSHIWIANAINDNQNMFKDISNPFVAFEVTQEDYDKYRDNKICLLTLQKSAINTPLLFDLDKMTKEGKISEIKEVEIQDSFYPEKGFFACDETEDIIS